MKLLKWIIPAVLLLFPVMINAQSPEEKGLEIANEIDLRESGFHDYKADMQMILRNKHGQESTRSIRIYTLEQKNDGDKTLSIFDTPRDVKGTAFLTFSHKFGDDDQWLYLPALKRVKRISSRNKSGSFMGSEFAYEDISSQEVEKYTYKKLEDETYREEACFTMERYPVDKKNSGYTRQKLWVDKAEYRVLKIDYYDRKNSLLKTYEANHFEKYLDKFWKAHEMNMVNHQNSKTTRLLWSNFKYRVGMEDKDFNKKSLKRLK